MKLKLALAAATTAAFAATAGNAAIVSVVGDVTQIAQPAAINNGSPGDNKGLLAFDELQGVTLLNDLMTDQGVISAGTTVSSHMILFNRATGSDRTDARGSVSFSDNVIGTMSDINGALLDASDFLGAPSVYQSGFNNRGLENNDTLQVGIDSVLVDLVITQPGDWVRVITEAPAPVPVPAAGALMLLGLGALGVAKRKQA